MTGRHEPDRLRQFIDIVVDSLDDPDPASPESLARRAYLSRFHFDRLFKASLSETPHALRQRLLLERAAYRLEATTEAVTLVAFDSGFSSLEGFSRAFSRAFGHAPSHHRRVLGGHRLPSPNGVHFHPPSGVIVAAPPTERKPTMDLTDRLLEHDQWLTLRIIDAAGRLTDAELDQPTDSSHVPQPWEADDTTVRAMLDRLVMTREVWNAALAGHECVPDADLTVPGFQRRASEAGEAFSKTVRRIREADDWDTAFVDACCDPPAAFTFGGMASHVLTFNAARRVQLIAALSKFGIDDIGYGDPLEWERMVIGEPSVD